MNNNPLLNPQIKVNLNDYPAQYCKSCGGELFLLVYVVKHVPALHIGAPMDRTVKQEVFICVGCRTPLLKIDKTLQVGVKKRLNKAH